MKILIAKISLFIGRQMGHSPHAGPCLLWRVLQCKYQIWTNNDSFSLAYDGSVHLQFCLHTFLSTDDPGSAAEQSAINVHLKFLFSLFTIYTVQWEETGRYLYCQAQVHVQVHVRSEKGQSQGPAQRTQNSRIVKGCFRGTRRNNFPNLLL